MADGTTVGRALVEARARLRAAEVPNAALDARLLVAHVLRLTATGLIVAEPTALSPADAAAIDAAIARRLAGEPVGRIVGRRAFFGLDLALSRETLEPRPDTETLVQAVLDWVGDRQRQVRIVDVGTGTGAVLIALLSELPNATGLGTDISADAAATAARNAQAIGVAGRAGFTVCDAASAARGPVDVLVSNPPYIPSGDIAHLDREVREHDPRAALDGGPDGLAFYRQLAGVASGLVSPKGVVLVEFGIGQAESVAEIFGAAHLARLQVIRDLEDRPRVLRAEWQ
ncbi:release factor glutamine methyltransferase [Amorphus suaedae]